MTERKNLPMNYDIASPRRGRPRTGRIEPWRDRNGHTRYRARITLKDGSYWRLPVPVNTPKAEAKKLALDWQIKEDTCHGLYLRKLADSGLKVDGETTGEWFARYTAARAGKVLEAGRNRIRWNKYIGPHLNPVPMALLNRTHVEAVRDSLDLHVRAGTLHGKSALNVWCVLTKAMREAVASKLPGIRCRDTNPCDNVLPPDSAESRQRPWLFPREMTQLLSSEAVSLEHRQLYAIAVYTYLRPGELAALTWADVNFDAGVIHVRSALNWDSGETKAPKTRNARRSIPIHRHLRPLLEALRGEPDEHVWSRLNSWDDARGGQTFRTDLMLANVTRTDLHAGTVDTLPVDFRSLRTTGATWAAISGLDGRTLERRIGHADKLTTDRYVGVAEDLTGGAIGEPFPELPANLISSTLVATKKQKPQFPGVFSRGEGGIRKQNATPEFASSPEDSVGRLEAREQIASMENMGDAGVASMAAESRDMEVALSLALTEAAKAGRFDVVAQIARELEARRLAGGNVVPIAATKPRRGRS